VLEHEDRIAHEQGDLGAQVLRHARGGAIQGALPAGAQLAGQPLALLRHHRRRNDWVERVDHAERGAGGNAERGGTLDGVPRLRAIVEAVADGAKLCLGAPGIPARRDGNWARRPSE
jgi:hypothetical protein